jgi:hypothetical protein
MDALARARHAYFLCRKAAGLACEEEFEKAEKTATMGIDELKERLESTRLSNWILDS